MLFLGERAAFSEKGAVAGLVTPDTCADIIYWIDYTSNTVHGGFCGINDVSFSETDNSRTGISFLCLQSASMPGALMFFRKIRCGGH